MPAKACRVSGACCAAIVQHIVFAAPTVQCIAVTSRHNAVQVEGTEDPLDARVVLHGWFKNGTPFCTGESLRVVFGR